MNQKKIRWGILGTGVIARQVAQSFRFVPDAELTAVGSRSMENAQAFSKAFGVLNAYGSYEQLVTAPDIDVIYVATPNTFHASHSLLALSAGKAVLCEKPFTTTAKEARAVVAKARASGRFCMEAMWTRFIPAVQKFRELVRSGLIGEVRMFNADLGFANSYDPASRLFNSNLGGGAFLDLGIYPLSLASFLFGPPDDVVSRASIGPSGVDESASAVLHYPDGKLANLTASLRCKLPSEGRVVGTRGAIRLHAPLFLPHTISMQTHGEPGVRTRSVWKRIQERSKLVRAIAHGVGQNKWVLPIEGNGYHYEIAEVVRCLQNGKLESDLMPLDETIEIMDTMDRIRAEWRRT